MRVAHEGNLVAFDFAVQWNARLQEFIRRNGLYGLGMGPEFDFSALARIAQKNGHVKLYEHILRTCNTEDETFTDSASDTDSDTDSDSDGARTFDRYARELANGAKWA